MSYLFGKAEKRGSAEWFAYSDSPSSMSESDATGLAPVFASIRHLVDYVSTLPADFYRKDGDKLTPVGVPELIRNVDDEYGLGVWLGQAMYSLVVRGNAVGRVESLSGWGLPTQVRWAGDWSGGEDGRFWINGKETPDSLVAHIPWLVPPGKRLGLSPIEHFAAIIRAGLSAQEYADVQRGGGIPPTVLKNTAKTITAEVAASAQAKAVTAFATGKPFVTGSDWDLTATAIPPNHAQFIETLNLSANATASIYGIDPREIGGHAVDGSLVYTNDESRALNRAANNRPYIVRLEHAIDRMLPEKIVMKLNIDATMRADIKTRTEVDGQKIKDGRLSVDEARAHDELGPVKGGSFHNVPTPISAEPTQRNEGEHHE